MSVEETWQPPPALAEAPTVVGSGQAVLACLVLGCVLVLGGLSVGGLATPTRSIDTFAQIDVVRIGAQEPRIHVRPLGSECGSDDAILTCHLEVGGRSIEVRADRSARSTRCAVLADRRPVPCMVGLGVDRNGGALVSIVDDLDLPRAEYRRLADQHREDSPTFLSRMAVVGPAALALGLAAAFVTFRTLPVTRCTSAARRVAALGTGFSFAAGLVCWWISRLVAAGQVF